MKKKWLALLLVLVCLLVLDIFIHIAYVAVLVVLGAEWLGICPDILLNSVLFCYFVIVWMMFFALWILEFVINGKEHRSRY